jgi:hypothetical protein
MGGRHGPVPSHVFQPELHLGVPQKPFSTWQEALPPELGMPYALIQRGSTIIPSYDTHFGETPARPLDLNALPPIYFTGELDYMPDNAHTLRKVLPSQERRLREKKNRESLRSSTQLPSPSPSPSLFSSLSSFPLSYWAPTRLPASVYAFPVFDPSSPPVFVPQPASTSNVDSMKKRKKKRKQRPQSPAFYVSMEKRKKEQKNPLPQRERREDDTDGHDGDDYENYSGDDNPRFDSADVKNMVDSWFL